MSASFKAIVSRDAFLKCIGRVYRVIEKRHTIPILGNVLIRSEAGRLVLRATDLDIQIVSSVEAKTVSARRQQRAKPHG